MESVLEKNVKNREKMISAVEEEIIGPIKNFTKAIGITESSTEKNQGFYFWNYGGKKEEVYTMGKPSRQYAAGLLYPQKSIVDDTVEIESEEGVADIKKGDFENIADDSLEPVSRRSYQQSTMGITFAVPMDAETLHVKFTAGIYENTKDFNVSLQQGSEWWFRKTVKSEIYIDLQKSERLIKENLVLEDLMGKEITSYTVKMYKHVRNYLDLNLRIITLTFENTTPYTVKKEENAILFQCQAEADLLDKFSFAPYPKPSAMGAELSFEDRKFELLYSSEDNFAFGHDCSTEWEVNENGLVYSICTSFLPTFEIPTITPDIMIDNKKLEIKHSDIAAAKSYEDLVEILSPLVDGYKKWYSNLASDRQEPYHDIKENILENIQFCITRIERGMTLLQDKAIFECFKLANLAMLMQMTNGTSKRKVSLSEKKNLVFDKKISNHFSKLEYTSMDNLSRSVEKEILLSNKKSPWKQYKWRGFQIAFILQSIESIIDKESEDRNIVDLIWFPTGGGKTEAYLGVAAFSMLYRRYLDPNDGGVDIMMRYTLRLLTADQFQRSARLISSLEYIRKRIHLLGDIEYSIGLWVGATTTPNSNQKAGDKYLKILERQESEYIVEMCPWCGAEMSMIESGETGVPQYLGYKFDRQLHLHCPDINCEFHEKIPIYFVDEQLYKKPPTFLIGTIDKFVQLTWIPEARSLFGIDNQGNRKFSPPNIIIQDEFHLISGPLGTLTGMYEVLIDELTTDRRNNRKISAKIVAATATIKDYKEQVKAIFGKTENQSQLFPPSGYDINDNFFSTVQVDEKTGIRVPGRKYVGVFTTTQGKLQTQVQTLSSLIAKTNNLPENERDPYWTILSFYNTIRDIGMAITLTELDIPNKLHHDYLHFGYDLEVSRKIKNNKVKELTSRLESGQVSKALEDLKIPYSTQNNEAFDICLASNIIEVGIDINRLSLMTIVGQPKTTSQYIQVSGRVGRRTNERPGLVIVLYNPQNSNDKSHFEHFNEYHQKLYGEVEVNSVTPFSDFSIERGFPAALIGYMRQNFELKTLGKRPDRQYLEENLSDIKNFILKTESRARIVDQSGVPFLQDKVAYLLNKLMNHDYARWEDTANKKGFMDKMTKDRDEISDDVEPIIFSMRSVDASSKLEVRSITTYDSSKFLKDEKNNNSNKDTSAESWLDDLFTDLTS